MSSPHDVITLRESISNCCDPWKWIWTIGVRNQSGGQPRKSAAGVIHWGGAAAGLFSDNVLNIPKVPFTASTGVSRRPHTHICPSHYPSSSITASERRDGAHRSRWCCLRCAGLCGLGARAWLAACLPTRAAMIKTTGLQGQHQWSVTKIVRRVWHSPAESPVVVQDA